MSRIRVVRSPQTVPLLFSKNKYRYIRLDIKLLVWVLPIWHFIILRWLVATWRGCADLFSSFISYLRYDTTISCPFHLPVCSASSSRRRLTFTSMLQGCPLVFVAATTERSLQVRVSRSIQLLNQIKALKHTANNKIMTWLLSYSVQINQ